MFRTLRNLRRLLGIARTLARHDALVALGDVAVARPLRLAARLLVFRKIPGISEKSPGERLSLALQALGPAFIKLGQVLSVRVDLIGEEMADDLAMLQDRLPPFTGAEARATIEAEFGQPVEDIFETFDQKPVAAASIAQVHRAVTAQGDQVAVKVLRPGVEDAFRRDLDLMAWLAELVERNRPALKRLKPVEVVKTLADSVAMELDLRLEAAAADELRKNFEGDHNFIVPKVDWTRTARRVLTTDWINGVQLHDRDALEARGHDLETVVANLARAFFLQVFRDGFFHADLHPGNLFIAEDGAVIAVDFGIMGRVDKKTRQYLAEMLLGFLTGDYDRVAKVHFRAGYVPANQSVEAFAQAARSIAEPILGLPLSQISLARLLAQLFQVTERFQMETQPQLLLLQKTMLVAEGVGRGLYPDVNMWELARPMIADWMAETLGPEARIRDAVGDMVRGLERLPALLADVEDSVDSMARDGLRLHPDTVRAVAALQGARRRRWPVWAGTGATLAIVLYAMLAG